MKQEMMGWQWHQLDNMQIICTSLQTNSHASTSPLDKIWTNMGKLIHSPNCLNWDLTLTQNTLLI